MQCQSTIVINVHFVLTLSVNWDITVLKVWDYEVSVERKSSTGGTSKARVMEQIVNCKAFAKTL